MYPASSRAQKDTAAFWIDRNVRMATNYVLIVDTWNSVYLLTFQFYQSTFQWKLQKGWQKPQWPSHRSLSDAGNPCVVPACSNHQQTTTCCPPRWRGHGQHRWARVSYSTFPLKVWDEKDCKWQQQKLRLMNLVNDNKNLKLHIYMIIAISFILLVNCTFLC